jgi:hypothetical protein
MHERNNTKFSTQKSFDNAPSICENKSGTRVRILYSMLLALWTRFFARCVEQRARLVRWNLFGSRVGSVGEGLPASQLGYIMKNYLIHWILKLAFSNRPHFFCAFHVFDVICSVQSIFRGNCGEGMHK